MSWRTREGYEDEERAALADWAMCSGDSSGRLVEEAPHAYRTAFQRDRDRIIHARAFRRMGDNLCWHQRSGIKAHGTSLNQPRGL